jgi:predicted ATPase with chaperone activity
MARARTRRRFNAKWGRKTLRKYQRQGLTLEAAVRATLQDALNHAGISVEELQRVLGQRGSTP